VGEEGNGWEREELHGKGGKKEEAVGNSALVVGG